MSKMIQIRNVPDSVHATLKSRAALAGQPLTEFLLAEIRRVAERPSPEELAARLLSRSRVRLTTSPAEAVRADREAR
jgi:plasmid stability protein